MGKYLSEELEEYISTHLEEWNDTQKDIWLKLSSLKIVERNDTGKLIAFSIWFDHFFMDNHRYPSFEEVLEIFIGDKDETKTNS